MHIQVEWLNGRPVGIELPSVVELTVVQTSPVMRGATKTASTKPAKLSNGDRKSTRLNSSHSQISYAVFCLKKKKKKTNIWCMSNKQGHNENSAVLTKSLILYP